ncbi:hypothetical protein KDC22_07370 [Paenibacillus tritici]|uniref:hypothetical protein n=1 Tax=Paenibacillus tritici TaxID=1873425 RepID=UPI001BAC9B00|nr:hypothetical protein [Paenibacillus tritici]QUL56317.1 hypothetical protein KDC22_07370 [Paenibacillus tritici]
MILILPNVEANSRTKYIYNKNGQLIELNNSTSNYEFEYDRNGNLINRSKSNNLLSNSGYENYSGTENVADSWNPSIGSGVQGTYEILTTGATEGKRAQKLTVSSFPNSGDGANIWQEMFIKGNQSYNIKGMLKLNDMKNAKFEVIVFFYDANNQYVGGQTPFTYNRNTVDWVAFAGNITTPAHATSARVHLHLSSTASQGKGTVFLDGITATLQEDSNLAFNNGFESDKRSDGVADGWNSYLESGVQGTYEILTTGATEGKRAQKLTVSSFPNSGDGANIWQEMFIKGNQSYNIKGMLKLNDMKNAKFEVIVFFYDANNQYVGGQTPFTYNRNTVDWVAFAGNITAPAHATSARVHLHLSSTASQGKGTVFLDGITATSQEDSNLAFNNGFETDKRNNGVADGWNSYLESGVQGTYEILTTGATEGKQAQKLTVSTFPNSGDGANIWQEMFVKSNQSYNIKGMLKLTDMKNAKFEVIVFFYDMNNQFVGGQTPFTYNRNSIDWVAFAGNITAPAHATSARVHLHLSSTANQGTGTVFLDDVSLKSF